MNSNAYLDSQWSKDGIEKKIAEVSKKDWSLIGNLGYGAEETECLYDTLHLHKEAILDKHVLVVGSETPWVESMLLEIGARHVTTLEYNQITSTHPKVLKTLCCIKQKCINTLNY